MHIYSQNRMLDQDRQEQDSQNRTCKTGKTEEDRIRTNKTGLAKEDRHKQDRLNRTGRIRTG
jgi:hypothetical protein